MEILNTGMRYMEGPKVIADRILAAIEKEREGDVEVHRGEINNDGEMVDEFGFRSFVSCVLKGKSGQLIFLPAKGKGE